MTKITLRLPGSSLSILTTPASGFSHNRTHVPVTRRLSGLFEIDFYQ